MFSLNYGWYKTMTRGSNWATNITSNNTRSICKDEAHTITRPVSRIMNNLITLKRNIELLNHGSQFEIRNLATLCYEYYPQ